MQSSKVLIRSFLVTSLVLFTILVPSFNQPSIQVSSPPIALDYTISYSNLTVDLAVTSSTNSYLFIVTQLNKTSFTNQTDQLSTQLSFSFHYPGQTFSFSAGLTTIQSASKIDFFVVNKTIDQPDPFYISHSIDQTSNSTKLDFTTNSELDLDHSYINSVPSLTLDSTINSLYFYNAPVTSQHNYISFIDMFNRSYKDSIIVDLNSSANSSNIQFDYSYDLTFNSLLLTLNSSLSFFANVDLNSSIDHFSKLSSTTANNQTFSFPNLSYTMYQVTMRVWTTNISSVSEKTCFIDVNDTTKPKISSYSIQTGLTTIQANFSFTKKVLSDFSLIFPNGTIHQTNTSSFQNIVHQNYIVPIGTYKIFLSVIDKYNNINTYTFTDIKTQHLGPNSSLNVNLYKRIFTIHTPYLVLYPELFINGTHVTTNDSLVVTLARNNLTIQIEAVPFSPEAKFIIDTAYIDLQMAGQLDLTCSLPLYHLSVNTTLDYVINQNTTIQAPDIVLQSYASNYTSGTTIALHLQSYSYIATIAYVDIFCPELNYSLSISTINITNNKLDADFFVPLPQTNLQYLTLEAIVYSGNYTSITTSIRIELTDGFDTTNPDLFGTSLISTNNSIILLTFNTTEPVHVEVDYGNSTNNLISYIVNGNYQSSFLVNFSSFMVQNVTDYYYFKLIDSSGHETTYNNGSFYSIFVPKIDFIDPWNTSLITIGPNNVLSFTANEEVTIKLLCDDLYKSFPVFSCGSQRTFGTNIAINLQVPVKGMVYIVQEVIMTDRAGNNTIIALDLSFNG